jgi:hypothetical protein
MDNTIKINCNIDTTDAEVPLGMEIWIDNKQIFNQDHVREKIDFCYELKDVDAEHELQIVMTNKTAEHTQIDQEGKIIKDACLIVSGLEFDGISLGHTFTELATYTHDFNGTGKQVENKFFGTIGCNGTVSLKFTTPIYLWLLENM